MSARTWKSVYDIPFDVLFRGLPYGLLTRRRFTIDTSAASMPIGTASIRTNDYLNAKFPKGFVEVAPLPEGGDQ